MIVIVMGVVGAGKTTIGSLLAQQLGWEFADADDYHPRANVEKICNGIPLTDEDRTPWLQLLRKAIIGWSSSNKSVVLACSALKREYRQTLQAAPDVRFVYLYGPEEVIADRLRSRHGHYADARILESQLADLEEPAQAVKISIEASPEQIVREIRKELRLE